MKKKVIIIIAVVVLLILLIPIPLKLKDGGSIEYKSLIYKVTKVHRINTQSSKYDEGITIEIFGKQIYTNVVTNVDIEASKTID